MEQALHQFLQTQVSNVSAKSFAAVLELAAEGATVPFIARYRKDKTGNMDEVQVRDIIEAAATYTEIVKRKDFLVKEIGEQGNLTSELKARIEKSWNLGELEEIYKPFKKKKKTKATIARDAGLEPLANWIWEVGHGVKPEQPTMEIKAKEFLNVAAGIATYDLALKGAQDILVEKISNEPELRVLVTKNYFEKGKIASKRSKNFKPHSKFEMYADFSELAKSLMDARSSHRYLAMRRGWEEEELTVEVIADSEMLQKAYDTFSTTIPDTNIGTFLKTCAKNALTAYVIPSVQNELHRSLKEKADLDAIRVFTENVRKVLLASPFGPRVVLGVDPGLKTGCKVALIDKSGQFITHTVMQILGEDAHKKAVTLFSEALKQMKIDAIAVGNGTAGRQTETFLRKVLKEIGKEIPVVMVSESGASVYSASDIARQEFPDLDVTIRGAISIARRLQDPLSELVKVDPKSIGVGQYQHDVNQGQLKKGLDAVVESCVNAVGVDLNTASAALLSYVSGIGPALAQNIIAYRKEHLFQERGELLKVPKFSQKAYEQAAGFLRILGGKVFLDSTGIHPERYTAVRDMAQELGVGIADLSGEGAKKILDVRTKWAALIGEYTLTDIVKELEKPGRDPRDPFKAFQFKEDIFEVKDLKEGMVCPGIVTNVTNFGAFVDIGVHQDGLVHISELSDKFVDDPRKIVNPGDQVTVRVIGIDLEKSQVALSMKLDAAPKSERPARRADGPSQDRPRPRNGDGPRGSRNDGPRGPRPDGPRAAGGGRRDGGRPQQQGPRPGGGSQRSDQRGPPRPAGKPFNNPFAALQNANLKK